MYYVVHNLEEKFPEYDINYHYIDEEGKKYCVLDVEDEEGVQITKLKLECISVLQVSRLKEMIQKIEKYIKDIVRISKCQERRS